MSEQVKLLLKNYLYKIPCLSPFPALICKITLITSSWIPPPSREHSVQNTRTHFMGKTAPGSASLLHTGGIVGKASTWDKRMRIVSWCNADADRQQSRSEEKNRCQYFSLTNSDKWDVDYYGDHKRITGARVRQTAQSVKLQSFLVTWSRLANQNEPNPTESMSFVRIFRQLYSPNCGE